MNSSEKQGNSRWGTRHEEIASDFLAFEQRLGLLCDETIGREGRLIWEAMRYQVFNRLCKHQVNLGDLHREERHLHGSPCSRKLRIIAKMILTSLTDGPHRLPRSTDYLISAHPRRKWNVKGYYEDIYSDPFIELLGPSRCVTIERYSMYGHSRPTQFPTVRMDALYLMATLRYRLKRHLPPKLSELSSILQKAFHHQFGCSFNLHDTLMKGWAEVCGMRRLWHGALRRCKPRYAIVVCSYVQPGFVLACKDFGIPVVELQHGTLSPLHMGYSCAAGSQKLSAPDYYWSFGEYWQRTSLDSFPSERMTPVGFPYFERMRPRQQRKRGNRILVLSQASIGNQLSQIAARWSQEPHLRGLIDYKLHPGEIHEWRSHYPTLAEAQSKGHLRVIDDRNANLYDCMQEASWLVGVYSTAVFEGLALGLQTVLVDLPGIAYMEPLIRGGHVRLLGPDATLVLDPPAHPIDPHVLFKPNWQTHAQEAISRLEGGVASSI